MAFLGSVLLALAVIFSGLGAYWSYAKFDTAAKFHLSGKQAIDQHEKVLINGVPQSLFIRTQNPKLPVLLHLHGGPGFPASLFSPELEQKLPFAFTLVHWDQRGAGKSYLVDQHLSWRLLLQDTESVIQYLQKRFGQQKIYVVGKSWGSLLGLTIAEKHPEWLRAYVGVSQIIDVMQGDPHARQFIAEGAKARHEQPPNMQTYTWNQLRNQVRAYGGLLHQPIQQDLFWTALRSPLYGPGDYLKAYQGFLSSQRQIVPSLEHLPAFNPSRIQVPIFFFHGRHDGLVPSQPAIDYLAHVQHKKKAFIWFEQSAHSPNKEEPAFYQKQLQVLFVK